MPVASVTRTRDVVYAPGTPDARLDVYLPREVDGTDRTLPTVVWVHGGGFVAGSKDELSNYLTILAADGYAVVALDYSRAPGAIYPTPVRQVMAALGYLAEHAAALHLDMGRVVLAGDSAGAQITAQTAAVVTHPDYARRVGIEPTVAAGSIRGCVLYCGAFDPTLAQGGDSRLGSWFLSTVMRAYVGTRRWEGSEAAAQVAFALHATEAFPATFISAGNSDPLLPHSSELAAALAAAGVETDALFFPDDQAPLLRHEYQFDLTTDAGEQSFRRMTSFLATRLRPEVSR